VSDIRKYVIATALATSILFSGALISEASGTTYTVQSEDSLFLIAKKYNVTVGNLQEWNQLKSTTIYVGQQLQIAKSEIGTTSYKVKSGDSLWSIAKQFGTTVVQIKHLNNMTTDTIYIGQTLQVTATAQAENQTTSTYTVKAGDTLSGIAKKFGTTVQSIQQLNALTSDIIKVGQNLKITGTITPTQSTSNIDNIIAEGKKYIGIPYVWGGSTPNGFDCSGFLNYIFAKNGVSIPRTVITIWNAGTKVTTLQKGDLVFFETYASGPSHVGLYLGNRQFLHASSSAGVTISSLDNSYWSARYLGAKSIISNKE
jgi:cell wall-associated NlpC family hydrolase